MLRPSNIGVCRMKKVIMINSRFYPFRGSSKAVFVTSQYSFAVMLESQITYLIHLLFP
jgi:hypothetical protein